MIIAGSTFPLPLVLMNTISFVLAFSLFIYYPYFKRVDDDEKKYNYLKRVIAYTTFFIVLGHLLTALCPSLLELVFPFSLAVNCLIACSLIKTKRIVSKVVLVLWGLVLTSSTGAFVIAFTEK